MRESDEVVSVLLEECGKLLSASNQYRPCQAEVLQLLKDREVAFNSLPAENKSPLRFSICLSQTSVPTNRCVSD